MRDHLIRILADARAIHFESGHRRVKGLAESICTEAMAALQGGKHLIPSKLFGEITIPQDVIPKMSNGDDDLWFSHGPALDINIFYDSGWHWAIYPIGNEGTNTDHLIEKGVL